MFLRRCSSASANSASWSTQEISAGERCARFVVDPQCDAFPARHLRFVSRRADAPTLVGLRFHRRGGFGVRFGVTDEQGWLRSGITWCLNVTVLEVGFEAPSFPSASRLGSRRTWRRLARGAVSISGMVVDDEGCGVAGEVSYACEEGRGGRFPQLRPHREVRRRWVLPHRWPVHAGSIS